MCGGGGSKSTPAPAPSVVYQSAPADDADRQRMASLQASSDSRRAANTYGAELANSTGNSIRDARLGRNRG